MRMLPDTPQTATRISPGVSVERQISAPRQAATAAADSPESYARRFTARWHAQQWQNTRLLIACSGGSDSTALVRLFLAAHPQSDLLSVAHFNHGLRGCDSDRDEQFVRDLCATWRLPLVVGRADAGALAVGGAGQGLEAAARTARYQFLRQAAETLGARYLATAHHADDQCETVLHHILRGTGLAGLRGIPAVRVLSPAVTIVRPLLRWTRAELTTYLQTLGQPACHDHHNDAVVWTRNRIRHELLPLLEDQYHAGTRGSLLRLADLAGEAQAFLAQLAQELLRQAVRAQDANQVTVERSRIAEAPPLIRRELFVQIWHACGWPAQSMSSDHWQALADMATAPLDSTRIFPGEIRVQVGKDQMQLTGPATALSRPPSSERRSEPRGGAEVHDPGPGRLGDE